MLHLLQYQQCQQIFLMWEIKFCSVFVWKLLSLMPAENYSDETLSTASVFDMNKNIDNIDNFHNIIHFENEG